MLKDCDGEVKCGAVVEDGLHSLNCRCNLFVSYLRRSLRHHLLITAYNYLEFQLSHSAKPKRTRNLVVPLNPYLPVCAMWRQTRSDYRKTSTGVDLQPICKGCTQIEVLLDLHHSPSRQSKPPVGPLPFHSDFSDLSDCAQKCYTCRVFRQALLSRCGTSDEAANLAESTRGCPVFVRLRPATESSHLAFKLQIRNHSALSAVVETSSAATTPLNLPATPHAKTIPEQAVSWLHACRQDHKQSCAALRWSSENPTRLVKVLSSKELQLCSAMNGEQVQYVALTYAWGSSALTEMEQEAIQRGMTTQDNVESRSRSFSSSDLPATLREALVLLRRMGISYAWIDSVCIIQDADGGEDFAFEAPKMHSYYGNALFTLAVCSNEKATLPLLVNRVAYSHVLHPCHLRGRWLAPLSTSPSDVLRRSPLAKRAWTLQEEHLSPRILYWTASRMYWSCAGAELSEMMTPTLTLTDDISERSRGFLVACRQGKLASLHKEWLALVMSYSLRDMTNVSDRFAALSGLASRYQSSCLETETYLSGLWQSTLAHDLSWRITSAPPSAPSSPVPSWTWASLPLCTGIEYWMELPDDTGFEFLSSDLGDMSINDDGISMASMAIRLHVYTRLRPLWPDDAQPTEWSSIIVADSTSPTDARNPVFSFELEPQQSVFSAEASGLVVSYEARRKETVGQMDYTELSDRIMNGSLRIYALQLTEMTMLLLEKVGESFRRVGMSDDYRSGFFEGVEPSGVELV